MSTLASLFKKISQPNPAEIDPEDGYHSIDARVKQSTQAEDEEKGKEMMMMGPSQLRLNQDNLGDEHSSQHQKKYAGKLVSVKDWMDPEIPTHGNSREKRKATDEDEDKDEGMEDDNGEEEEEEDHSEDDNGEDENEDEEGEEDSTGNTNDSRKTDKRSRETLEPTTTTTQEQPSDLIKHLQSSVKADIEKGKAVKKQLTTYDRILAIRIGLQKPLIATNKLIEIKSQSEEKEAKLDTDRDNHEKEQAQIAIKHLLEISSKIGTLREGLMESIDGEDQQPPSKRSKLSHCETDEQRSTGLMDCLEQADQLDQRLSPYLETTVRKWSTKINSTTGLNPKKFNGGKQQQQQNVMDQLDQLWSSKEEREKLITRSRTSKHRAKNHADLVRLSDSKSVFEDRDFYLSLLKDVVETATRNQEESMIGMNDYRSQRTHRESVDTKASKGRKIRYDIHKKLLSIMVPIQNELWNDQQKDELFGSLFGFGFEVDHQTTHHKSEDQTFEIGKSDGFRLL
ncbi:hypothetical protein Pst134EA_025667 [Puccinia striiformis f. sp. tritici]|uniref:hypothetical protein n=1 Tax=Puccinia striiformis f. sp. tritici TaxID=168172 RepID=UPI00200772B6|nr:hypothetical protein Pst134EA_025667 [Puccinia striiformis f. sp. tritici]KAH9451727.1 hypothetical protein Pst134EA_025667 [Puccinia striiformis f. sp. tritici]